MTNSISPKIGLSSNEALSRLKINGENIISRQKKFRPLLALLKKFNSPLLWILITVSLISYGVGQHTNAAILLMMVLISALLDFFNTYKSEKAVADLTKKIASTATVWRDNEKKEIPFTQIVIDDVIFLSAGDIVPADAEVLESDDFFVNQSALTGESFPVEKTPRAAEDITADRKSVV